MEWTQAIAVILSSFGMGLATILFIVRELRQISRDINAETRDFHGRMCRLEERYLQINEAKKL